jgi:hypothetical protein
MANNEARELFQTFSLLSGEMAEGYRQTRKEEDEERRKARREQLLLTIFGPPIAEGVTNLIKAPFEEPVNRFLATESTNIYDDEGNIVGQNRGGLPLKRFLSDMDVVDKTITSVQKAAERGSFSSVQDYFADAGIRNVGAGIENIVGPLDYKVQGSFNGPNIDTSGRALGNLDYDEYKELVDWRSRFGTKEEVTAQIAEQNPVPKNLFQAAFRATKRIARGETKATVSERSVRNLEDILGVELTDEGHQNLIDLLDRAGRVGNVYNIPDEVERLMNHPENVGFKELVRLRRGEAKARTQGHIADRQFVDDARAGEFGNAGKRYVSSAISKGETPSFRDFVGIIRQDIALPEWDEKNVKLYSDIIKNDDSVRESLEGLRDDISARIYNVKSYEDLEYEDDVVAVDAQLDRTLDSVFGAAQMLTTRQLGAKLDSPEDVQKLNDLGLLDPDSLKGRGLVFSNMRYILNKRMGEEDVETGWWLWSGTDKRYTGGIDLPALLDRNFKADELDSATNAYKAQKPSEEDSARSEVSALVNDWQTDLDNGELSNAEMLELVNGAETNFINGGIDLTEYRIAAPMLKWRDALEGRGTELPAAEVQQYYARFIKADPDTDLATMPVEDKRALKMDTEEKLISGLKNEWYKIGRPLYLEKGTPIGTYLRREWGIQGPEKWTDADLKEFNERMEAAGGLLNLHQEEFWDAKEVDLLQSVSKTNINDSDVRTISDWFMRNPQHLESLGENNYNLIEFVIGLQSAKK